MSKHLILNVYLLLLHGRILSPRTFPLALLAFQGVQWHGDQP